MKNSLNELFLAPLFSGKKDFPVLNNDDEDEVWLKAKQYLLSGFLLNSYNFHSKEDKLKKKLQRLTNTYIYKFISMKADLIEIKEKFEKNNIKFILMKGFALNLLEIYNPGVRHLRDIDILVNKDDLPKSYKLLRSLNFNYRNKACNDNCKFLAEMHHLPPLINKKNTILELHHRVTSKAIYEKCPLTDNFLNSHRLVEGFYVPSKKDMLAHVFYHGVTHDNLSSGPNFLFDIKNILEKYPHDLRKNKISLEKICKKEILYKIFLLFEEIKENKDISVKNIQLVKNIFNGNKIFLSKQSRSISARRTILKKLDQIRYDYQTSFFSLKYLFILMMKFILYLFNKRYSL